MDNKGQTFLEFILIMATMIFLSIILQRNINRLLGKFWENMVEDITNTKMQY